MKLHLRWCAAGLMLMVPVLNAQKPFTLEQVTSEPFPSNLTAAPAKGRVAWVFNALGRRNVWVAEPAADGNYKAKQITSNFWIVLIPILKVPRRVSSKTYGPFRSKAAKQNFWEKATRLPFRPRETTSPIFSRARSGLRS